MGQLLDFNGDLFLERKCLTSPSLPSLSTYLNGSPCLAQAGVFWNPIGRNHCALPLFLLCLWSNYNQTWHDGTLGQNLSKAIKILLTSTLGDKYDVIKPFLVSFQVKIRVPLSFVQWS